MVAKLPDQRKEATPKINEKRMCLWSALSDYIHTNGGWLVSHSGEKFLRVEVRQGSSLPAKLLEFGYDVHASGIGTRVTSNGIVPVDCILFSLPSEVPTCAERLMLTKKFS